MGNLSTMNTALITNGDKMKAPASLKPSHYPFKYTEQSNTFMPRGRLVTADGQILVDGINSGDFGYRLALCINFCEGADNSDLENILLLELLAVLKNNT